MCGIAGHFAYEYAAPPVDRGELRVIRDHMAARGPDGQGEWFSTDGRVGLAHRRLSIIDLSARAAQPMVSTDGQLVISFNGEIYNYRHLKKELEAKGRVFRTESDTEVLLHLYAEKGSAMLHDLRGMFAFALWDAGARTLLLARDAFGIKPLYYADDGKSLRFASQVKALLADGHVDTRFEPAGHAGFFLWGSVPEPWTLYKGIRSLPAGHFLRLVDHKPAVPQAFCQIHDVLREAANQPAQGTEAQALDGIAHALHDSIAAHQVADVPVGAFLSAGLDSAMITAAMCERNARPRSLTLSFAEYSGTSDDEAPMAERLAALLGTRHSTLLVRREDFEEEREKLLAAMDQPSIDGVNTWFIARAAASQGIKVALSGLGGDELFGSYPSFKDLPRITRLAGPLASVPALGSVLRTLLAPLVGRVTSPKYASLLEYGGTLGGAYLLRRGLYMPWELPHLMGKCMAHQGLNDLQILSGLEAIGGRQPTARLAISALEMSGYMRNQLLRDTDWASMAHSIEVRVPLLDVPLLCRVAAWLAVHPHLPKHRVASTVCPKLPGELISKPKTGFTVPVRSWLLDGRANQHERGLRGWSRLIYKYHMEHRA
jgi:asparagine synthase (glutamine-hydrolysing)